MVSRNLMMTGAKVFDRLDGLLHPLRAAPVPQAADPARILVWTVDRIGDVVRATVAIKALRLRYPQAEITAVVANRALAVLEHSPHIDRLVLVPNPHSPRHHRDALRALSGQGYDLGVLIEVEYFWIKLGQMLFRRLDVGRWVHLECGLARHPRETLVPVARDKGWDALFADLAHAAGAPATDLRTHITLPDSARQGFRRAFQDAGIDPDQPYLICHPGTSALVIDRSWPPARFGAVIRELYAATGIRTCITGLPAERALARDCMKAAGADAALDMTGRLSLPELMAALERAELLLVNDTGPLHLANAFATPTVAVLGPTAPSVLGVDPGCVTLVHSQLPCQPCAWHSGLRACTNPDAYACLKAVTIADVTQAAFTRLKRTS